MTPKVRFKGFDDAWEQRKLGDCFSERSERSSKGELIAVTINSGVVKASSLDRHDNSSQDKSNYKVVMKNDIAYNSMRMWQGACGVSAYNGILSPAYTVVIPNTNIDSSFFAFMFKRYDVIHKFRINSQGLTSDTWNLKFPAFSKISIKVPSFNEQKKISNLFNEIEKSITLHQRQCDALKKQKQFFLQNMFPKEGESVPRIRFNGFTEPWEQRKLGDCFSERSERSSKGELIAVTINSGVVKASSLDRHDNSSQDKSNYKVVMKNDIAYNSMRMWQGACGVSAYNGILSPAYTVVIPNTNIDSSFFAFMFKRYDVIHKFRINSQGLTSDTWNLKFPAFSKISIKVPSFNEQKKISNLFNEIEKSITLHQQQYEQLVSLKKYLLSKMFI